MAKPSPEKLNPAWKAAALPSGAWRLPPDTVMRFPGQARSLDLDTRVHSRGDEDGSRKPGQLLECSLWNSPGHLNAVLHVTGA
jgi:hypothetical protein